jgi:fructokinase
MFVVCGESLMDVYVGERTSTGLGLSARVGGSPFNVAVGLARLQRPTAFLGAVSTDAFGVRLLEALAEERVDVSLVRRTDAPTTLGIVELDPRGVPRYAFHGEHGADRQLRTEDLPALPDAAKVVHFGSYAMVVAPVGEAQLRLAERERSRRLVAYDPNVRLNVEPAVERWQAVVDEMARHAHLLKISAEDLALLYPGTASEAMAARWLAQGVRLVVLTHGAEGSEAWTAASHAAVPARPVALADTVGAGDSFEAALLAWLDEAGLLSDAGLAGLTAGQLEHGLQFATRAAAITCGRRGADLPRRGEL